MLNESMGNVCNRHSAPCAVSVNAGSHLASSLSPPQCVTAFWKREEGRGLELCGDGNFDILVG